MSTLQHTEEEVEVQRAAVLAAIKGWSLSFVLRTISEDVAERAGQVAENDVEQEQLPSVYSKVLDKAASAIWHSSELIDLASEVAKMPEGESPEAT
jgi:hypothetical protein